MKKVIYIFIAIAVFILFSYANKINITDNEKIAQQYIKSQGYKIISSSGQLEKYTLEKSKFSETVGIVPLKQIWGLQKNEPDGYFGKEIYVYGFIVTKHPLEKKYINFKNGVSVYVMVSEGTVIGGYSRINSNILTNFTSLDGRTLQQVKGISFEKWNEKWKKNYEN